MSQTPYSTPRKPQLVSVNGSSKPSTVTVGTSSTLEIIPLGAGEEVGRSCIIVKYQGKTIMFDCGIYPANTGISSLPYFDSVDLSTVDLCLISHFHLDHVAALPYLTEKTDFRGRVLMTYPTKWISKLLLEDFIKMGKDRKADSAEQQLYSTEDVTASLERAEVLSYSQTTTINGIKVSCFCAGHVLGAALFMIEVDGVRVLYTGDFSSEKDRHLQPADVPPVSPDVIIVESTYGTTVHEDKNIREDKFTKFVHSVVENGGTCLVAVFALGRTQELILILEEYWAKHKELSRIPIYYTSKIAKKCLGYFKSCTNMMNDV